MKSALPVASKIAIAILVLLSFGPFMTGLDLALHFLPTKIPAIQNLHSAPLIGKLLWVGSGFLGVLAVYLRRRPVATVVATLLFVGAYVPGAALVWAQFTFGCWLAIATFVLTAVGSGIAMRANSSFKPKPLRGSA